MNTCLPAVLISAMLVCTAHGCPDLCLCKWKSGKEIVECNRKGFLAIPESIDPSTQVLHFSENSVEILPNRLFFQLDLINLQKIYLSRCGIVAIHDGALYGLTNLVELDLSYNLLSRITADTFADCRSLMTLSLASNPIKLLGRGSFNNLVYLKNLELSSCEISGVEEGAFQGLNGLETLHLDGNRLTTLKGSHVFPESLKGIELQANLWECDCHMLDLHAWLVSFRIPQEVEPVCKGPVHLAGRTIRSISESEFACLPNISPTSFYLELGEGKNVSLICQVHAVPEASLTWRFQGQTLQNDSLVAPGVHLIYFVEEGTVDKKSELFIFNTNTNDNGTFVCNAENSAGVVESNFTIRIIVKEEPIVIIVSFTFEHLLVAVAIAVALTLVLVIIVVVSIVKCRRSRRRQQKREQTKEITTQYQQNDSKCVSGADNPPDPMKIQNTIEAQQEQMMLYAACSKELLRAISPYATANQVRSPSSLKRYQLEQNPDLINDTERRLEADGEDEKLTQNIETVINPIAQQQLLQFTCSEFYNNSLLDADGYPIDYGLPKLLRPVNENFYRTLPYNRAHKRHQNCYPKEAEFLTRPPQAFEHYCQDIRYTADGYPVREQPPAAGGMEAVAPASLPCCSNQQIPWPTCVPADLHMINSANPEYTSQPKYVVNKRCVGAQTEKECDTHAEEKEHNDKAESVVREQGNEVLTESPDEGYEGETSAV